MKNFLGHFPIPVEKWDKKEVCVMESICMICGRKKHVLREGKLMLCTRCITALGLALGEKLEALQGTPHGHPERSAAAPKDRKGCAP